MSIYNIIYTRIQGWYQWCWSGVGTHRFSPSNTHPVTSQASSRHPQLPRLSFHLLTAAKYVLCAQIIPDPVCHKKKIGISWTGACDIQIMHDWHMFRLCSESHGWHMLALTDLSSDRSGAGPGHQEIEIWLVCDPTNRNVGKPMP